MDNTTFNLMRSSTVLVRIVYLFIKAQEKSMIRSFIRGGDGFLKQEFIDRATREIYLIVY